MGLLGNSTVGFKGVENWFSWNNLGHVLCVDQPLNVGFSKGASANVTDSNTAASHFINFLYNFVKARNLTSNPIYLTGESYAGHYIPAIASSMLSNRTLGLKLQGIAMGDAWIDPQLQSGNYGEFLLNSGVQGN